MAKCAYLYKFRYVYLNIFKYVFLYMLKYEYIFLCVSLKVYMFMF